MCVLVTRVQTLLLSPVAAKVEGVLQMTAHHPELSAGCPIRRRNMRNSENRKAAKPRKNQKGGKPRMVTVTSSHLEVFPPAGGKVTFRMLGEGKLAIGVGYKPPREVARFPSQTRARKAMREAAAAAARGDLAPTLALRFNSHSHN